MLGFAVSASVMLPEQLCVVMQLAVRTVWIKRPVVAVVLVVPEIGFWF